MRPGWLWIAAVVVAAGGAEGKTVSHLTRRLDRTQSGVLTAAMEKLATEVIAGGRRAGPVCETVDRARKPGPVRPVTEALATAHGLAPLVHQVNLRCGADGPRVRLNVATDARNRADLGPPRDAPISAGVTIRLPPDSRRLSRGASTVFVQTEAALLRLDVEDEARPGTLAAQLDQRALLALAQAFAPLPPPPALARGGTRDGGAKPGSRDDERAIVAALMAGSMRGQSEVVVAHDDSNLDFAPTLASTVPDVDPSLFAAFVATQKSGTQAALPANARAVPTAELRAVFKPGPDPGWKQFARRFPNSAGVLSLTPIAFSNDGTQAAVATGWQFGAMDGVGTFCVLQRGADGAWSILYEAVLWLS